MAFVAILCGIKLRKNKIAKTEDANQEKQIPKRQGQESMEIEKKFQIKRLPEQLEQYPKKRLNRDIYVSIRLSEYAKAMKIIF